MQTRKDKKLLVFDMDGTLYKFKNGSFVGSKLQQKVSENVIKYIMQKLDKTEKEAERILENIKQEYGEEISIALSQKFNCDRYEYFDTVWDIPANGIVKKDRKLKNILDSIKQDFNFILVSDAPKVWIKNVLEELKISNLFNGKIFSGEDDNRKSFGNHFAKIIKELEIEPKRCVVFGDQEATDIIPAKKLGMITVFVNATRRSEYADYNIKEIKNIDKILEKIK